MLAPECYDEELLCGNTVTILNTVPNVVANGSTRVEDWEESIIAHNVIQNGGLALYRAGEFIELLPNFNAQNGSVFSATIEECLGADDIPNPLPRQNIYSSDHGRDSEQVNEVTSAFTVHPNPTTGRITVIGEAAAGVFTVIDITGKELLRVENSAGAKQVDMDLSGLSTGVYFLSADGVNIQKVIRN